MLSTPQVRAAAVVRNDDGDVLLVRHVRSGSSFWTLPGGAPHPTESVRDAAIREVSEETGFVIAVDGVIGAGSLRRDRWESPQLEVFFAGRVLHSRAPIASGEHVAEHGFFPLTNLPSPLLPPELPHLLEARSIVPFFDLSVLGESG